MSEQTLENAAEQEADSANETQATAPPQVDIQRPEFAQLRDAGSSNTDGSLGRFFDVNVTVSAELGRVTLPIGELVQLGEGSVVELNRPVTGPVDLMANGVRIARGDVVVVDGCFAIHIKQIEPSAKAG
ncbi:MAG: FliM/FliN family flagellar motor switch protein [Planctomycetales bacterium]|nr:FliM/FliN family flagellar motor switch protein [Planctomycetales bacterium]